MYNYPLRVVETMIASGQSFEAIESFIENGTHLSDESRSALWLFAWTVTSRENRPHHVSELTRASVNSPIDANGRLSSVWGDV